MGFGHVQLEGPAQHLDEGGAGLQRLGHDQCQRRQHRLIRKRKKVHKEAGQAMLARIATTYGPGFRVEPKRVENAPSLRVERRLGWRGFDALGNGRSEEQTSELQSLMRISYAVVCLK